MVGNARSNGPFSDKEGMGPIVSEGMGMRTIIEEKI